MELSNKKLESRLTVSRQETEQLQQNLEIVRTESLTDPLAALANRKFFNVELGKAIADAKQCGEPQTLLMCDVDHFKALKRQIRAGDRRPGPAPRCHVDEAERQGTGHRGALWRRGLHRRAAEGVAAPSDHRCRPHSACRHDEGTDETIERRTSRSGKISIGVAMLRAADTPADRARRRILLCRQAQSAAIASSRTAIPKPEAQLSGRQHP
jgi:Diguanylate cyclase, GGDEF domain